MEPADLRNRNDAATWRGLHDSWLGTVVVERSVGPRGVVVAAVAAEEPAEMGLVEDEEMIQALPADGADHPLHERVLPGCAWGGEDLADPQALDVPHELLAVDTVTITEQVSRSGIIRERLDELPGGPGCRGMVGDVEVDEFTAVVAKDHERAQQAEGEGRDHGSDQEMQWRGEERRVQVSPKLAGRTQWVRVPTGEWLATALGPSLATSRVTGTWKRRQGVHGPVCASPENYTNVAAAETVVVVEGNTSRPPGQGRSGPSGYMASARAQGFGCNLGGPDASRAEMNRCG